MLLLFAWFSAGVFVLVLVYVAHFVVTLQPQPTYEPPLIAIALNLLLFGVFAAHHSLMARTGVKRWLQYYLPTAAERSTYVLVASALLFMVCLFWRDLPGTAYSMTGWFREITVAAQVIGVVMIAIAVSVLDPLELAGVRQVLEARLQRSLKLQANDIRMVGPYRWVRHPLYLGWILVVFGEADMSATRLAFASISTAYLLIAIPWEEARMAEMSGKSYERYCQRVRWRIVPGLW